MTSLCVWFDPSLILLENSVSGIEDFGRNETNSQLGSWSGLAPIRVTVVDSNPSAKPAEQRLAITIWHWKREMRL